jgi:hypothetical protein
MNYNFFASESDKIELFNYLFASTDLQIFDSYSLYGQKIRQYKSLGDLTTSFDLANGGQFAISLQLWAPSFLGNIWFERIALKPQYCDGYTFRYCTRGWGLLSLHLGGEQHNTLRYSNISHLSEKAAIANEEPQSNYDKAADWDWLEINRISRHLKYFIHNKMAVSKMGSLDILPGAAAREKQGVILR